MRPRLMCFLSLFSLGIMAQAAPASGFVTPAQLRAALTARASGQQHFTLINVHTPYEGRIAGTDLLLPYDTIGQSRALPTNKKAALILYCRSGNMSADAHATLNKLGYTNVRELQGGFNAWKGAGYPLK